MITKRVKKLFRLIGLAAARQGYFLGRNWYELSREPYLTLKGLKDTRDKSQIFLVSLSALAPLFLYVLARIIYDLVKYGSVVVVTGPIFKVAILGQGLILAYLGYWAVKVLKEEK